MARLFLAGLCVLLGFGHAWAQPKVGAIRFGEHPDKTRFVLELSEAPRYRVFTLPDPFRVVIDLPELDWDMSNGAHKGQGLVEAMRFGLFAPGTSRIVLDLAGPGRIKSVFTIPPQEGYPYRLVIDIAPVTRAAYFASPREPVLSDPPLAPPRSVAKPTAPPESDQRPLVVIDPGHGGVDPGARSLSGVYEKEITLDYARELKSELEATGRYRVAMTRDRDIFVRLRDRMEMAQSLGADIFISLHANNHASHKIRGVSVYTLSETASDAEAEALAAQENKADAIAGINLADQTEVVSKILIDLAQRETMNLSKRFANGVVGEVGHVAKLLGNTHRYAGFAVLKSPTVPSVLVEIGYLSNPREEKELRTARHRKRLTDALVKALDAYFARQESLNKS